MKLSRRAMLAAGGAVAALRPSAAQPPAPAATPTDLIDKARADNRRSAETLAKFPIPMSTEPAFAFRA